MTSKLSAVRGKTSKSEVDASGTQNLIFHKHYFWYVLDADQKLHYWLEDWELEQKYWSILELILLLYFCLKDL